MILVPVVILIVSIVQRLAISLNARTSFDTYGHLYFAKEVKDQKAGPFGAIEPRVVNAAPFRHPFLWHWMIGFLPFSWVYRHKKKFNAILDGIFAAVIVLFCVQVGMGKHFGVLAGLLYIFTPMWFSTISIGPRVASLTPRLISEIALNLYFMLLLVPIGLPLWLIVVLTVLLGAYTLLSSKFGIQAIFFLSPCISLFTWDMLPLIVLIASLIFSIAVTRGDFFLTLSYQLRHMKWYFLKNLRKEMQISNRNRLKVLTKGMENEKGARYFAKLIFRMIGHNSFTSVILKMPVFLVGMFLLIYFTWISEHQLSISYLAAPVLAGACMFFVVNIPVFLFLGEAERYLNHVAFFIIALTISLATSLEMLWVIYLLLSYGVLFTLVEVFWLHRLRGFNNLSQEETKILSALNEIQNESIVICYPYTAVGSWRVLLETKHKIIYPILCNEESRKHFEESFVADYPFVRLEKLEQMSDEYGINIVIAERQQVEARMGNNWKPSSRWKQLDVGQDIFIVYIEMRHCL